MERIKNKGTIHDINFGKDCLALDFTGKYAISNPGIITQSSKVERSISIKFNAPFAIKIP